MKSLSEIKKAEKGLLYSHHSLKPSQTLTPFNRGPEHSWNYFTVTEHWNRACTTVWRRHIRDLTILTLCTNEVSSKRFWDVHKAEKKEKTQD